MAEQPRWMPRTPVTAPAAGRPIRRWLLAAGSLAVAVAAYLVYQHVATEPPVDATAQRSSETRGAGSGTRDTGLADSVNAESPVPSPQPPAPSPQPPVPSPQPPASAHALPAAPRRTADTPPQRDGWEGEAFNELADKQLKMLAGLIAAAKPVDAEALAPLATDEVTATPLTANNASEVFHDATFIVRRSADEQPVAHRGLAGLADAINDLIASLGDDPHVHAKFKTVSVDLTENRAATTMIVQIGGPTKAGLTTTGPTTTGSVQWNSFCRCTWTRPSDGGLPKLTSIVAGDFEEIVAVAPAGGMFADCTEAVLGGNSSFAAQLLYGVDHWTANLDERLGIDVGGWQGIAIGDVNGDGLDDIYICQPGGLPNRLYVQNPDGTAIDVSASAGVDLLDATHAALFADFDNDGDQDLAVAVWEGVALFANDGRGRFTPAATALMPASFAYSLAAADYDRDGDLDLFVCGYNPRPGVERHILFARPVPYHDANNGGRSALLRNDGPAPRRTGSAGGTVVGRTSSPSYSAGGGPMWRFRHVTVEAGLDENNRRFSYAAAWCDYDGDGDDDLFVANDFGRDNLYRNDGGVFRDVAAEAGVDDIGPGMSAAWGDYDNDGRPDLYVANMFSSAGNRVTTQSRFLAGADAETLAKLRHHARGNSLYRNLGGGRFRDVSIDAGVTLGRWAWGSVFVDLNNDGWQDIYVANGFITQEDTGDL